MEAGEETAVFGVVDAALPDITAESVSVEECGERSGSDETDC